MPNVFISYSHDSDEHRERVRGLHASLSRDGCDCRLDVFKDTDEDWPAWMAQQLIESDFVLCVVTETYERRFRDTELPDRGLGVGWEAGLIRRLLYGKKLHNSRIFPVVFDAQNRSHIPLELQGYDEFRLDGSEGYEALLRKILNSPLHSKPATGVAPNLATSEPAPLFARPGDAALSTCPADISRIVKYAPPELIGREAELKLLDDAWNQAVRGEKNRPHIVTFVALGGEGKTSLVAKWAATLAAQDWPGCEAAFAWSFYSQGTREQVAGSSDVFLREALVFFGDEATASSPKHASEKARRLAQLVGQRRALLILDGVEPLQYPPLPPMNGQFRDQGLADLLKALATTNRGLCVVTTRYSLPDLQAFWQTTAAEQKLWRLSPEAGVRLLKTLGVKGAAPEFDSLVEEVKGHALT
ncbi:MAG: toll/interleukin-1 receptor domain-containing protein, partial [Acidobacteria bacterium]|nr:toll/interleukin-1 receptor domain-containing protein [Acidobacteriota bacterium]